MNKILSNKKVLCLFLLPTLLITTLIVVIPIFISFYYSMLDWDGIGKGSFIGLHNYIELVQDTRFLNSVKNSLLFAALSIFIQLPFSLLLAIVVANVSRGEKFYRTAYFIPVIISTVVIGQLWQKIYNGDYGLLNALLDNLGLTNLSQDWLGQEKTALLCSFIPILWQYVGYHMLIMYAGVKSQPPEYLEAALMDGASKVQVAFRITIPLLKPILKVCVTFSLIGALKVFDLIYVLTNGGPFFSTEVPSIYMYTTIFDSYHYGYGSAISIFIILECLLFTVFLGFLFKEKEVL
ncbi:carbohydrate ABC transporter permease [Candidatus Galacturonibacter soehngenii]|uniref:Sugar ABC transporter permease n=1 Tax=Candidatus Galacturonatibacter soehngenii TaxID=2307010 RepID=A0A7V7QJS3_9FIRM|nr:sugar ABC transporter permease [Candidatus Galacturonibacter soehngenii]KAB1437947.1 sugar ABC transporter permease [Candidatus Galacturonibacter soehngenii]MBA4687727.1 sugar ABC transporter permease [Candidatus Galacturonibacter soehngenii]